MRSTGSRFTTRRIATVCFVAGLGVAVGTQAMASTWSNWGYYTAGGVDYKNQSSTQDQSGGGLLALSYADTTYGATVPAGWIGASTDLDHSDGSLCATSGWYWNSSPTNGFGPGQWGFCGAGYYYTIGATEGWNGNGYDGYYTFRTPNDWVGH